MPRTAHRTSAVPWLACHASGPLRSHAQGDSPEAIGSLDRNVDFLDGYPT